MPSPTNSVHHNPGIHPTTQNTETQKDRKTVLENHGYYLGKTIGAGSYATVRMAHSEIHGGDVAIKIVSKYTAPEDYLKKFLPREIEVVKGLKHPNLIRFLQAIETTHRVYIVMEYAENGSLLDIIRRDSYIDETRARKWFRQLVDAIDYCHERGVVHRDIKCENLLMDREYNIKVSDFGFARGHLKNNNGHSILSETFCGSYAYASPEILKGIPYQPQYSDVWSMGVVLYAMVFGRLPFDDANYSLLLKELGMIHGSIMFRKRQAAAKDQTSDFNQPPVRVSSGEINTGAVNLLTKQQLKEEARKQDKKGRRSSSNETPLLTHLPGDNDKNKKK